MARPCSKCDDAGAVELEQRVADKRAPLGFRIVTYAYRCDCPAGDRKHPNLRLLPAGTHAGDLAGSVSRHPAGAPEGIAAKLDAIGRKLGVVKPEQQRLEEDDEPF